MPVGVGAAAPTPPEEKVLRRAGRRLYRPALVYLAVGLACLVLAGVGSATRDTGKPAVPPGGSVIEGQIVGITPFNDVVVLDIEVDEGSGPQQVVAQEPVPAEGRTVWVALAADGTATEVVTQPIGPLLLLVGGILFGVPLAFFGLMRAAFTSRTVSQLRRPLVPAAGRLDPMTNQDKRDTATQITYLGLLGRVFGGAILRFITGYPKAVVMFATTSPVVARVGVSAKARRSVANGPVLVPSGVDQPLTAWCADGSLVRFIPARRPRKR